MRRPRKCRRNVASPARNAGAATVMRSAGASVVSVAPSGSSPCVNATRSTSSSCALHTIVGRFGDVEGDRDVTLEGAGVEIGRDRQVVPGREDRAGEAGIGVITLSLMWWPQRTRCPSSGRRLVLTSVLRRACQVCGRSVQDLVGPRHVRTRPAAVRPRIGHVDLQPDERAAQRLAEVVGAQRSSGRRRRARRASRS